MVDAVLAERILRLDPNDLDWALQDLLTANEITAARELFKKLDLDGKCVSLDALHTQQQTATELILEHGADYFFTVKGNQPNLSAQIKKRISEPDKDSPFLSPNQPSG